jgi:nicotinate-nucleotide adenylyltransferase
LLHDVTKENTFEKQLQLCQDLGIMVEDCAKKAPKTLHAITGAAVIGRDFPEFADPELINAVRWHTTGRANMSICEKIIYLADYIEETREFEDCVSLREYFWGGEPQKMAMPDRLAHLSRTLVISFDMTVRGLESEGAPVDENTLNARKYLVLNVPQ